MISKLPLADTTALLLSGGLDSAILMSHLLAGGARVQPIYVASGCVWELAERRAIDRLVAALNDDATAPVVELQMPVIDLYGDHWSTTSRDVPDGSTADEAVHLIGRNPLLLIKAVLWCQLHGVSRLAIATLASNPFPDATPQFFGEFAQALHSATERPIEIVRPFAQLHKQQVLALGAEVPLELTFSCLAPHEDKHCGACNKCAERARALRSLPDGDPTVYADRRTSSTTAL